MSPGAQLGPHLRSWDQPWHPAWYLTHPRQLLAAWQFQAAAEEGVVVTLPLGCALAGATKQKVAIRPERLVKGTGTKETELEAGPYQSQHGRVVTIRPWPAATPQSLLHYAW